MISSSYSPIDFQFPQLKKAIATQQKNTELQIRFYFY